MKNLEDYNEKELQNIIQVARFFKSLFKFCLNISILFVLIKISEYVDGYLSYTLLLCAIFITSLAASSFSITEENAKKILSNKNEMLPK